MNYHRFIRKVVLIGNIINNNNQNDDASLNKSLFFVPLLHYIFIILPSQYGETLACRQKYCLPYVNNYLIIYGYYASK